MKGAGNAEIEGIEGLKANVEELIMLLSEYLKHLPVIAALDRSLAVQGNPPAGRLF